MNLKLIESFVELIELGAFANKEDIVKGLNSAIKVTKEQAELTDEEIIESLAELEHEQWMKWADTIMQTEKISDVRFARWASCMIPYAELTEEMKEFDREWARKALAILRKAQEKPASKCSDSYDTVCPPSICYCRGKEQA